VTDSRQPKIADFNAHKELFLGSCPVIRAADCFRASRGSQQVSIVRITAYATANKMSCDLQKCHRLEFFLRTTVPRTHRQEHPPEGYGTVLPRLFLSSVPTTPVHPGEYRASRVSEGNSTCYDVGPSLRPTSFLYSGSSRRQSRSESLAAQFLRPYPAANAFLSVSSASAFFPRTPYVHAAL
jgi:hypothetical protein